MMAWPGFIATLLGASPVLAINWNISVSAVSDACAVVHPGLSAAEACAFVKHACTNSSLYPYVVPYYCLPTYMPSMSPSTVHAGVTLFFMVWLLFLFSALGLVASDFFCPNLSSIAGTLGMSDSVVGVTFLALGNGAPDVVSTFRAMDKQAGALALGELMGAAVCTISVVCGSIMVFHSFSVPPFVFLRDVGTYALAVAMVLYFLLDHALGFVEGLCMLALYVTYIGIVLIHDWYWPTNVPHTDVDEAAPLLPSPWSMSPTPSEMEAPSTPQIARHSLLSAVRVHDLSLHPESNSPATSDLVHNMIDPAYSARNHHLYRPITRSWSSQSFHGSQNQSYADALQDHSHRPSMFRSASATLSIPAGGYGSQRQSKPLSERRPTISPLAIPTNTSINPSSGYDSVSIVFNEDRPKDTSCPSPSQVPTQEEPGISFTNPDALLPTVSVHKPSFCINTQSPLAPPSDSPLPLGGGETTLPKITVERPSLATLHDTLAPLDQPRQPLTAPRVLSVALFPSMLQWSTKSLSNRIVSVLYVPALFLLRLTVPLISADEYYLHQAICKLNAVQQQSEEDALWKSIQEEAAAVLQTPGPIVHTHERVAADHWLQSVQCCLVPTFICWMSDVPTTPLALVACVGAVFGGQLWRTYRARSDRDEPEHLQRHLLLRSVTGFVVGLLWIVWTVDHLLALLRSFGYIFHWSEAILGLTVFALGNSLGDVVTNLSIARLGHPLMALTACFASPLTNLLLGIGFSATWLSLIHPSLGPYDIKLTPGLIVSCTALLGMLVTMLLVIPFNQFQVSKRLGLVQWATYVGVMLTNIGLEIH